MQTSILRKCLEELQKEAPRKDYVIGMLETLIEFDTPVIYKKDDEGYVGPTTKPEVIHVVGRKVAEENKQDEGEILDARTRARIGEIAGLAKKSTIEL